MFFNNKYINEANISAISYCTYSNKIEYKIIKYYNQELATVQYWLLNDYNNEIILMDKAGSYSNKLYYEKDKVYFSDNKEEDEYKLMTELKDVPFYKTYTNEKGSVEVTIKMNNGDSYTGNILSWGKSYKFINFELKIIKDVKKEYDEIDIEFVYNYINKKSFKEDKKYIQ
jgi:hypothetical protein